MAETKDFDLITVARSDGADTGPGYWPTTAPPAAAAAVKKTAADKAPRAKPQMTRLAEDDPRFTEWSVKIGILLKQELSQTPDEGNPWYVPFPRGYWLYEKSKHLWVSGYPIKAKLFKTPQEFALHLIWLLSGSKSYRDCPCVHCNPVTISKPASVSGETNETSKDSPAKPPAKALAKNTPIPLPSLAGSQLPPATAPKTTERPQSQTQSQQSTPVLSSASMVPTSSAAPLQGPPPGQPLVQPQQHVQQQQAQQHPHHSQHTQQPQAMQQIHHQQQQQTPQQPQQPQQAQPQQQQPPQAQQAQQQQAQHRQSAQLQMVQPQLQKWSLKSSIGFRVGELVWYQHGSSRLGIIAAADASHMMFEIIPIGHGSIQQQNVMKGAADIRPYQAFSIPRVQTPGLTDKGFDQVSWEAELRVAASNPTTYNGMLVDASKMGASKIDFSYSLWSPLSSDARTSTFFGCFLGSERVEIGDVLRVKATPKEVGVWCDTAVMGLRYILTSHEYPGLIFFRGPCYRLVTEESAGANALPDEALPVALREETAFRNQRGAQRWRWVLLKESAILQEKMARGRYYPTSRLLHILKPEAAHAIMENGVAHEQVHQLNDRMNAVGAYMGRKTNRIQTLGATVPHNSRLVFEPYVKEETESAQ